MTKSTAVMPNSTSPSASTSGHTTDLITGSVWQGDALCAGRVRGVSIVIDSPLSFWGGYDALSGVIIDPKHPMAGQSLAGRIMVMAQAKGSSSSSSVLAEAIRNGTGPIGIVLKERDLIISIGAIVAAELYDMHVPVVCVDDATYAAIIARPGTLDIEADASSGRATLRLAD